MDGTLKPAVTAVLTFDKVLFKWKLVRSNKEGYYMLRKVCMNMLELVNVSGINVCVPNCTKQGNNIESGRSQ